MKTDIAQNGADDVFGKRGGAIRLIRSATLASHKQGGAALQFPPTYSLNKEIQQHDRWKVSCSLQKCLCKVPVLKTIRQSGFKVRELNLMVQPQRIRSLK